MNIHTIRRRSQAGYYCLNVLLAICLCGLPGTSLSEKILPTYRSTDGDTLTFGVYAHVRSTVIYKKFSSISRYLERSLAERGIHKQVRLKIYTTYPEAVDALARGEADFVRYGPVSYILAKRKNPDIRLLAMESNGGERTFTGVIAVPTESRVMSVTDLKGQRIAFGDRNSTTGRYLSQAALVEAGLTAADFDKVVYLGRHDKVAFAVASGSYDAGAMNENTFNKYKDEKGLRSILQFKCVTKPWVAREGLDLEIYDQLSQILLNLNDKTLLKPLKRDGLLPAGDSEYDTIREAMLRARQFDELRLVFGTYASQRPADVYSTNKPVLGAIKSKLESEGWHVDFDIRIFQTYLDGINSVANGVVDIARLGPASYVIATEKQSKLIVIAQENNHSQSVEGVFIVRKDAPIHTLQDLQGKSFAFANEHSTAGRYLAQAVLVRAGITADNLKGFSYLGRHDKVAFAVAAGNYDAGVLRSTILERVGLHKKLRSVMRFRVPQKLWVARQGLENNLVMQLRNALTSLDQGNVLRGLALSNFVYPPSDNYEQVRSDMTLSREFGAAP